MVGRMGTAAASSQNGLPFASRSPSSRMVSPPPALGQRQSLGYSSLPRRNGRSSPTGHRSRAPSCRLPGRGLSSRPAGHAADRRRRRASSRYRSSRPRGARGCRRRASKGSSITSCQLCARSHAYSSIRSAPWWRLAAGRLAAIGGCAGRIYGFMGRPGQRAIDDGRRSRFCGPVSEQSRSGTCKRRLCALAAIEAAGGGAGRSGSHRLRRRPCPDAVRGNALAFHHQGQRSDSAQSRRSCCRREWSSRSRSWHRVRSRSAPLS